MHTVPPTPIYAYQIDLVVTVCSHRLFCSAAINVKAFPNGNLGRALLGKFLRCARKFFEKQFPARLWKMGT